MESAKPPLWYSEHSGGNAQKLFADACKQGIEGLVSKRADAPYKSGRKANWTKVTCRPRDTFYAVGIATKGRKFDGVYLARKDGDEVLYAGKVERGFSEQQVRDLKARLEPYRNRSQPLTVKVDKPKAAWFKPAVLVDVEFRALTGARKVRHPAYKGVREDLETPKKRHR